MFEGAGPISVAELLQSRAASEEVRKTGRIPDSSIDMTDEGTPAEARLWVLKAGLSPEEATARGFRYNDRARRVYIPVRPGVVVGRSIDPQIKPKYELLGAGGALYVAGEGRISVAVEDCLSAIRIAKAGYKGIAVLGTTVSAQMAREIADGSDTVMGWFDPDNAGHSGWLKLRRAMSLYPVPCLKAQHGYTVDPKRLNNAQIQEVVKTTMMNGS